MRIVFFIGIFGLQSKIKEIGIANNVICPASEDLTSLTVYKVYNYFHIFFIPTFKWNMKYIAKPACCGAVFALEDELGKAFEQGESPEVRPEHLRIIEQGRVFSKCDNCGKDIGEGFYYCPYCGERL